MNFVPCVAWVPRSKAASVPHKLQLSPRELKRLVNETKGLSNKYSDEDSEEENSSNNSEEENEEHIEECDKNENEEDDFDARYNLESYDNDDDENPLFTINDLAVHVDNHDDDYLTEAESEGDLEDKEDYEIKESDNLLISGHVEDKCSILEIHVYNQEEDDFYVHHDIVLAYYPLSLAWLDFHPADEKPGNYIAIGDMSSVIKIYDLDVVDVLEPDYTLGKMFDLESSEKIVSKKYHTDAVLSVSWNKNVRNLLASGSADSSVIIWDLSEGAVLNKFSFHSNKVQALEWHPTESQFILSGCTDGFLKLYDCQSTDECKSWQVEGEVEKVAWNLHDSFKFFCSTDEGYICVFDIRSEGIERQFHAHQEAITGLDMSPLRPNILISASMDRTLKVWDIAKEYKMIKSLKLKVGSIYSAKVAPDLDLTVAVGGNNESNSLKVINIFKGDNDPQENEKNLNIKVEDFEPSKNRKKTFDPWGNEKKLNIKVEDFEPSKNRKKTFDPWGNEINLNIKVEDFEPGKNRKKTFDDGSEENEFKINNKKKFKKSLDLEEKNFQEQESSSIKISSKHKRQIKSEK